MWTGNLLVGNRQLGKMLSICVRGGSVGDCYARVKAEEHSLDAQVDCMQLLYSHASLAALHFLAADGRCSCLTAMPAVYNASSLYFTAIVPLRPTVSSSMRARLHASSTSTRTAPTPHVHTAYSY